MNGVIAKAWTGFIRPLFQRPLGRQVAALCRREHKGETQVLLITSRGTGRWIIPKGWPIPGMDDAQSASTEAWEEAGVRARGQASGPVGQYTYVKQPDQSETGIPVTLEVDVYMIRVDELARHFPEAGQRKRRWVTPVTAAGMVREPKLQSILRSM